MEPVSKDVKKNINKIIGFLAGIFIFSGCTPSLVSPQDTKPAPLEFHPPKPETFELSNGIKIYYLQDKELPIVKGTLYLKTGSLWTTDLKLGVVSALSGQLRAGGAGDLNADELDKELERHAAAISSSISNEFTTIGFGALSYDFERILRLTADVVQRPRFDQERFSLWQSQTIEGIRRRSDSPETIGTISLGQILYGTSPLGRVSTDTDIRSLTRDDLLNAYQRMIYPEGALISVTGDIEKAKLQELLEKYLGSWKSDQKVTFNTPEINYQPTPGIYFVKKPFVQATVAIAQQGAPRLSPDYPAIDSFNAVFGSDSGFGSKLVKHIRSDLGLVYSVGGGVYTGYPIGKNLISLQTKGATTGEAIGASLKVLDDIRNGDISLEELEEAKRGIENSFIFKFDTLDNLVQRAALLSLLKYPKSYDDTYIPYLEAVTIDDLKTVGLKRWDLDKLIILVVGNEQAYQSLVRFKETGPDFIKRLPLREVTFDQKLRF